MSLHFVQILSHFLLKTFQSVDIGLLALLRAPPEGLEHSAVVTALCSVFSIACSLGLHHFCNASHNSVYFLSLAVCLFFFFHLNLDPLFLSVFVFCFYTCSCFAKGRHIRKLYYVCHTQRVCHANYFIQGHVFVSNE